MSSQNSTTTIEEENRAKWKGLLINALRNVQKQVHKNLDANDDALEYIESLIHDLLQTLCQSQPHSVVDVEERVRCTFPNPIDSWAIMDAQNALEKGKKKSPLVLPVEKIHPLIKEILGYKVDHQVTVYIVAVLEYIAADILKLTGNYVKNIKHKNITVQDIKVAMCADSVLLDMFFENDDDQWNVIELDNNRVNPESLTYEDIVKDLVLEETQYMRDLIMIIKVFREPFVELFPSSKDLETIFSNILDLHELAYNLLSSVEDTLEANEDSGLPLIGACFEDLAEGAEFEEYINYTENTLQPIGRQRLNALLGHKDVITKLDAFGYGFKDAVKYVLPKLLLGPIFHFLHYFDVMQSLMQSLRKCPSNVDEDKESLQSAWDMMSPLKVDIEKKLATVNLLKRKPGDFMTLRFQGRAEKDAVVKKMDELQKQIDSWEGKSISQSCHEFIMEGVLNKWTGKRPSERHVFLFDGLIIITKPNLRGRTSVTGSTAEYKLKEKYNIRRIDVLDREETETPPLKHAFELTVRDHPNVILAAKSSEEKNNWMAALVSLLRRSMLERLLDTKLSEEAKQQPLRLPKSYKFSEEDSSENIVFEEVGDQTSRDSPLIKGGTLVKLVERLTYHMYAEPKFVRTFLMTYRTFCHPSELLDLLIERFNIPEPTIHTDDESGKDQFIAVSRDDVKRFKKEYAKPVQFRVLNVLRHWVDQHWCDFSWNENILNQLSEFLENVKGKAMKKWVESIKKIINRKRETTSSEVPKQITFPHDKPTIEWHIAKRFEEFELMKLHPIEIARQVTLLEFDLYRAVKPSEMVGSAWVKKNKLVTSPNLLKTIDHSTRFTFWLEKCIIETENFEERVQVVARIIEIMMVFQELNNFNGVLEIVGALNSASVHRLEHTFEEVNQKHHKLIKAFDDAKELNSDHYKKYYEKLRSINPPCVPFLGNYLTNILLTEEGNPDFLPNRPEGIINFSKRRKVAAICGEIQQYQNQPYCLEKEPFIRQFFEELRPLGDMNEKEFIDYLYDKSLEIEPRNSKQPAKYEKKYSYSLKSPGIKPSSRTLKHDRSHSTMTLSNTSSLQQLSEENAETPPLTPSTPQTPTSSIHPTECEGDFTVFTAVTLPDSTSASNMSLANTSHLSGASSLMLTSSNDVCVEPPPLPPRRNRLSSSGCESLSPTSLCAPPLPQKSHRDSAPPLPPRMQRDRITSFTPENFVNFQPSCLVTSTMPRTLRTQYHPSAVNSTLPRRNSERDNLGHPPQFVNMNGERGGSVTPELPPKTYRSVIHSRQQSS